MSVVRRTSVLEALLVVALVLTAVGGVLLPLAGPGGFGLDVGGALLEQVGRAAVLHAPAIEDRVVGTFGLSLLPLAVAFGVGIAAGVFRQGAALRADVEGLV